MVRKHSKEELEIIVRNCKTKTEFALQLGYKYYNGKIKDKLLQLVSDFNLDISHFDSLYKNKLREKYPVIIKTCPVCTNDFETRDGHPKEKTVCSHKCSNIYFSLLRHSPESNQKRSETLCRHNNGTTTNIVHKKICPGCNSEFIASRKHRICCSQSCAQKHNWGDTNYRENIVNKLNERVEKGLHPGWKSRKKLERSYPEKYTISILDSLGIKYESEYKCSKWFIDFADPDRKLAFEVDGKQHELPERKLSDQKKDKYLTDNGWIVKRYKWRGIRTFDDRQAYIKIIQDFFGSTLHPNDS